MVAQTKGRDPVVAQAKGRDTLVAQADLSAPRVCSPAVVLLHNKGPRHSRKICANSLWLYYYYYYTQSSPTKNKNLNYIFIYLRVRRCSSSAAQDWSLTMRVFNVKSRTVGGKIGTIYGSKRIIWHLNFVQIKVGDLSRGGPEGSYFNSYYTEV